MSNGGLIVQERYITIQHGCKGNPEQVWYLKQCSFPVNTVEKYDHHHDQEPEHNDLNKSQGYLFKMEKDKTPGKIEQELKKENQ